MYVYIYTVVLFVSYILYLACMTLNASLWLLALVTDINIGAILCTENLEKKATQKKSFLTFVCVYLLYGGVLSSSYALSLFVKCEANERMIRYERPAV